MLGLKTLATAATLVAAVGYCYRLKKQRDDLISERALLLDDARTVEDVGSGPEETCTGSDQFEIRTLDHDDSGSLRFTQRELLGLVPGKITRGTRGKGIKIKGGEEVVDSNIHQHVYVKTQDHEFKLGESMSNSQLYAYAVGVADREGLRLLMSGGKLVEYSKEEVPKRVLAKVAHHAVYGDKSTHDDIRATRARILQRDYVSRWRDYDIRTNNRTAMPLLTRIKVAFGGWKVARGLSAPLPPRE